MTKVNFLFPSKLTSDSLVSRNMAAIVLFATLGCVSATCRWDCNSIGSYEEDFTQVLTLQNPSTGDVDIGQSAFNQMFWDSEHHILKRECDHCTSDDHKVIYYKRLTLLDSFDLYTATFDWKDDNNVLGLDFNLYSSLVDALGGMNPWQFCNYDAPGVGMFRDCNTWSNAAANQWTSRSGGFAAVNNAARFYIYTPPGMRCQLPGQLEYRAYDECFRGGSDKSEV